MTNIAKLLPREIKNEDHIIFFVTHRINHDYFENIFVFTNFKKEAILSTRESSEIGTCTFSTCKA